MRVIHGERGEGGEKKEQRRCGGVAVGAIFQGRARSNPTPTYPTGGKPPSAVEEERDDDAPKALLLLLPLALAAAAVASPLSHREGGRGR